MSKPANKIYVIDNQVIIHRNGYLSKICVPTPEMQIDGMVMVLGVNWDTEGWFIMPALSDHCEHFMDIGPFDECDDAHLHLKLMGDVSK